MMLERPIENWALKLFVIPLVLFDTLKDTDDIFAP